MALANHGSFDAVIEAVYGANKPSVTTGVRRSHILSRICPQPYDPPLYERNIWVDSSGNAQYKIDGLDLTEHEQLMARLWKWMGQRFIFCGVYADSNYVPYSRYLASSAYPKNGSHVFCECQTSLLRRRIELLNDEVPRTKIGTGVISTTGPRSAARARGMRLLRAYNEALSTLLQEQSAFAKSYQFHSQVD